VIVSTPFRRDAFYPDILAQQRQVTAEAAEGMKQTPMYELYPPRAEGRGLAAPEVFGLLGGGKQDGGWDGSGRPKSRLAILPGVTHYAMGVAQALAPTVIAFLDEPTATNVP
jgi:hypothetical protein